MTLSWSPVSVGDFTVRELVPEELWSQSPGDATAETIVEETAWAGAAAAPGSAREMLERWLDSGAWVIGLYREETLIGLFDVGRFTPWTSATGEKPAGVDLLAEAVPSRDEIVHVTLWYALRPSARGQVPGATFKALSDAFLRRLWDLGIRRMITTHLHHLPEGRAHAANVERFGWRTLSRRGAVELKVKRVEPQP